MSHTHRFASAKYRTASAVRSHASRARVFFARALSIGLIASMLAVQTPAAPQIIGGAVAGWQAELAFVYTASGWRERVLRLVTGQDTRPKPEEQEKQKDRDARITHIALSPSGEVTLKVGQRVQFTALAADAEGTPVSGVKFKWEARDAANKKSHITRGGEFDARRAGIFTVTAEAAGRSGETQVRVIPGVPPVKPTDVPLKVRQVSTRELTKLTDTVPDVLQSKAPAKRRGAGAPHRESVFVNASYNRAAVKAMVAPVVAALLPPDNYWDEGNWNSADDPGNGVGSSPGGIADDGAGSGNFQMAAPVLGVTGRGIDLALGLAYNSRVWNKAGSEITFDIDHGYPAPGWSLGFGKLADMGVNNGSMLVDADGTRHGYGGEATIYTSKSSFTGYTADGTFIDYSSETNGTNRLLITGEAKYPNGTVVTFGAPGQGAVYPTSIRDANGNRIDVTYRSNSGPNIETVTDTLGRAVQFHYDANNLLTAITAPNLNGGTRTIVRLQYQSLTLDYAFSNLTVRAPARYSQISVVRAIYYPGTNTGYWFGDADSYSSYGMLKKVVEQRGMSFSGAGLNDQGAISPGTMTQQIEYNYPPGAVGGLTDAPHYTTQTQAWDGMTTAPAVTTYGVENYPANPPDGIPSRKTTITQPNGTQSIQWAYRYDTLPENDPNKFRDGLIYQDETQNAAGAVLSKSRVTWEQGAYKSPRPAATEATNNELGGLDESAKTTRTEFSYGTLYNQVVETRDFDYGKTARLRTTRTEYENAGGYTSRHILNLPKAVEVWNGAATVRQARTEYTYDGGGLADTPGVVMHAESHNPYAPQHYEDCECWWDCVPPPESGSGECSPAYVCHSQCLVSDYDYGTAARGLVTQIKTYADAANLGDAIIETRSYDMTGNMLTASTACCEQMSVTYTDATQYAYPESQTRGSASDAQARVATSAVYDFNTGLALSATDANGRASGTIYDAATLRPVSAASPTGATTSFEYFDSESRIVETVRAGGVGSPVAANSTKYLNGLGQVRREEALGAGVTDVVETEYDNLGRAWRQSRPFRGSETRHWSETYFDALGRAYKVTAPDGTTSRVFYNNQIHPDNQPAPAPPVVASGGAGETTVSVDAWGRGRWGRTDAQGRLVEVVEPKPDGDGSVANDGYRTEYEYDTLGRLTNVKQGTHLNPNGVQARRFAYDSLGRLRAQKLAETQATLNLAGGEGNEWSDVFTYDVRSNMTARIDARRVTTTFGYNDDALNRLQSVSYSAPSGIQAAAGVTYQYQAQKVGGGALGDKTLVSQVMASGVSTESFLYDSEGRLARNTLTMEGRASFPMQTDYEYDTLDRAFKVTYPAQYTTGVTQPARKEVTHTFDAASRLSELKVGGANFASGLQYNAASQTTQMTVGNGAYQTTENYEYEAMTGLLSRQKVQRGAAAILDLAYDYQRNGAGGRTGHLTAITNNLERNKDKAYSYDALGRLVEVRGGNNSAASPAWRERYSYDRLGNRTGVATTDELARLTKPVEPKPHLPTEQLALRHKVELPDELKGDDRTQPVSDSPFSIFGASSDANATPGEPTKAVVSKTASGKANGDAAIKGGTPGDEATGDKTGVEATGDKTGSEAGVASKSEAIGAVDESALISSGTAANPSSSKSKAEESLTSASAPSAATAAVAVQSSSGAYYEIISRTSGKCMDVDAGQYSGRVQQWQCLGGLNQQWQMIPTDGGYYKLASRTHGEILAVAGGSQDNGATLHTWYQASSDLNVQWKPVALTDGYYKLIARHSQKSLDVPNGSQADGVSVQQYDYNGALSEQWILRPVAPYAVPGVIQAEDFDSGADGQTHHDLDVGNNGGVYRSSNVDIGRDAAGNYVVAWVFGGEWLQYTVNVAAAGTYTFEVKSGVPGNGASLHVEVDGVNATGAVVLPDTGAYNQHQVTAKPGVQLTAGQHTVRVVFDQNSSSGGVGDFDWFRFTSAGSTATKITPTGATASGTYGTNAPSRAIDGDLVTNWNGGGFPTQWIELDLGQTHTVSKVRLNVMQEPAGYTVHEVYGGASQGSLSLLGTTSGNTQMGQWLEVIFGAASVRYVRVVTTSSPSWVAWNEIEVYGTVNQYDAVTGFTTGGTTGGGAWSYGYRTSPNGGFVPFDATFQPWGAGITSLAPAASGGCCPMVARNATGARQIYAGSISQPADVLNLHPGAGGEQSVVRWTAPAAGTYTVGGRFQGIDTYGTTSEAVITHNGAQVFTSPVTGFDTSVPFSLTRNVAAGDTIEFRVGFGGNSSYNSDSTGLAATITRQPTQAGNAATFVRIDTTTQGNWQGVYGAEGYHAFNVGLNNPAYAPQAAPVGAFDHVWAASTSDVRALKKAGSQDRTAATWHKSPEIMVDIPTTDGQAHQVAIYCLDWDGNNGRAQRLEVLDGVTLAVLDTRSITNYTAGKWVVWNVRGHVKVRVVQTGIANALVSGIFFGAATAGAASVPRDGHQTLDYDTASNRITTSGFEYDAAGNQVKAVRADGSVQRMTYDAANRLVEVRNDANSVVYESYKYGVGNRRLVSESGGMRTYYAGGGGQSAVEYVEAVGGSSLVWSKTFIYMGGSLLATISPNGASEYVEYHHPDRLGTRLTTNNLNASSYEQATLPYGTALDAESTGATNRRFTSYDRSPSTGLDYAVNRTYDSAQGRFTQVDPIGMAASNLEDPQSLNLYTYCGNDPVNHLDPEGLFFKKIGRWFKKHWKILVGIAIIVAVAVLTFGAGAVLHAIGSAVKAVGSAIKTIANFIGKTLSGIFTNQQYGLLAANLQDGAALPAGYQMVNGVLTLAGGGAVLVETVTVTAPFLTIAAALATVTIVAAVVYTQLLGPSLSLAKPVSGSNSATNTNGNPSESTTNNNSNSNRQRDKGSRRGRQKWSCFARAHVVNDENIPNAPAFSTGAGHAATRGDAAIRAMRNASQNTPRGTHARHPHCISCIYRPTGAVTKCE